MKKVIVLLALCSLVLSTVPACAFFGSGDVDGYTDLEYDDLEIHGHYVTGVLENNSNRTIAVAASCCFVDLGDEIVAESGLVITRIPAGHSYKFKEYITNGSASKARHAMHILWVRY